MASMPTALWLPEAPPKSNHDMKAIVIIIAILAIIAFGVYKNSKVDGGDPGIHGGVGPGNEYEHTGEEKEPSPDDKDHDQKLEE